jgi:hypothetical protein
VNILLDFHAEFFIPFKEWGGKVANFGILLRLSLSTSFALVASYTLYVQCTDTAPYAPSLLLLAKNVCRPYRDTLRCESATLGTENFIPAIG